MKNCLRLFLCVTACALPFSGFAQESTSAPATKELKQPELLPIAFVKFQPPKELISELVATSGALGFESEAALLPFIIGGTLGDAELKSFDPEADICVVLLNALDRPQPYVFLTKLTPDAPAREKFQEMGLKLGKLGDWTILARNNEFVRRLEGSKSLLSIALKKRAADIEIGLWTDRLADQIDANKSLFIESLAANSEDFAAADTKASISGILDVMNGELRAMEYFMIGMNLSEERITSQLQLKGKADTALATYLSASVGGVVKGSEYIPKKGLLYAAAKFNPSATEAYFDYLLKKTLASTKGEFAAFFTEVAKLNEQAWKFYDGDAAVALNLEGEKPLIIQSAGSSYDPVEIARFSKSVLENFMNKMQAISPYGAAKYTTFTLDITEEAFKVGDISVLQAVTKATVDQTQSRMALIEQLLEEARSTGNSDMEAEALRLKAELEEQEPVKEVTTESTFMASLDGVIYSSSDRADLTRTLKAAKAGTPLPDNLSTMTLPQGCALLMHYDMKFFAELIAMELDTSDPLLAKAFRDRIASITLEPISVSVFQGDGKLSIVSDTPLRSIGELFKAAKAANSN